MIKHLLASAASLGLLLVAGCSGTVPHDSAEYRPPEGTRVKLNQTLHFPGRTPRVYLQFGEIRKWGEVNEWSPYCSFGLNRQRDGKPQVSQVRPGVFTVRRTRVELEVSQDLKGRPPGSGVDDDGVRVASLSNGGRGGTPALFIYRTTMTLYSDQQPQLDDLTCAYRGSRRDRNLSMDQIRGTLGDIATIQ